MANVRVWAVVVPLALLLGAAQTRADVRIDLLGHWGGGVHAVEFDGTYAYVGVGPRLVILDLSDPSDPQKVGQSPPLGFAINSVAISPPFAYIGLVTGGLRVVDISNLAEPRWIGGYSWPGQVWSIATDGNLVVTQSVDHGVHIFDVTAPEQPILTYHFNNPHGGGFVSIAIRGNYAYTMEDGLRVLDLTDPYHPQTLGFSSTIYGVIDIAPVGDDLFGYHIGEDGLNVVYLSDPWGPFYGDWIGDIEHDDWILDIDVDVAGNRLCLAGYYDGLHVYELWEGYFANYRATVPNMAYSTSIATRNGIACIDDWYAGLQIVDIRDAAQSHEVGRWDEANVSLSVSVHGNLAFLNGYGPGIDVLDVSNPHTPTRLTEWTEDYLDGAPPQIVGNLAFINRHYDGFTIVEVSDVQSPGFIGAFYGTDDSVYDLIAEPPYVYLADYRGGFKVVDVTDPSTPTLAANLVMDRAEALAKLGNLVLVARQDFGLTIVDVSTPTDPQTISELSFERGAQHVTLVDDVAFVSTGSQIAVVDVADPLSPQTLQYFEVGGWGRSTFAIGHALRVATSPGLRVLDASNPRQPYWVGSYRCQGGSHGLAAGNGVTYLTTDYAGLEIVAVRAPGDLDGDGDVDLSDLTAFLAGFGVCEEDAAFNAYADLDSDGCVDVSDLATMLARFGV